MAQIRIVPLTALFLFAIGSWAAAELGQPPQQTPATACSEWNLAALPPQVRKMIHLHARDVPAFPNQDLRLLDARNWPATMRIGAETCSLQVQYWVHDAGARASSVAEVPPSAEYCLFYRTPPEKGRKLALGPFYCWIPTQSGPWLVEKTWKTRDGGKSALDTYQYYASGDLLSYGGTHSSDRTLFFVHTVRGQSVDENFDRDGCLVAGGYWVDGKLVGYYVLGHPVGYKEFQERKLQLIRLTYAPLMPSPQ